MSQKSQVPHFCGTSFTRIRRHPSDLSGGEVFGLDDPLLRLVSSLIHDFFRIAPNRESDANFRHSSSFYVLYSIRSAEPRFPPRRETFGSHRSAETRDASTSPSVRFHYHITTNRSCDKSTRHGKSASMDNIHLSRLTAFSYGITVNYPELVSAKNTLQGVNYVNIDVANLRGFG